MADDDDDGDNAALLHRLHLAISSINEIHRINITNIQLYIYSGETTWQVGSTVPLLGSQ